MYFYSIHLVRGEGSGVPDGFQVDEGTQGQTRLPHTLVQDQDQCHRLLHSVSVIVIPTCTCM